ncbi:hypothetical protein P171DRAFT_481598 [Karstenula rhodostoma CBS 690.94]|uniref:Uncharacterized protein n=1 Tax=Karstenula rhodostoma CBS 690.94 TaxID=1392251 RepID=A0A9P4UFX7_9PLEO|nr:hypothetical protein P171DRAFT_481598 [Karstenula rhodostoma CBS 690.94]
MVSPFTGAPLSSTLRDLQAKRPPCSREPSPMAPCITLRSWGRSPAEHPRGTGRSRVEDDHAGEKGPPRRNTTTRWQGSRMSPPPPVTTAVAAYLAYLCPRRQKHPRTMELDAEQSIKLAPCTQDVAARWGRPPITTAVKRLAPPAHQRASSPVRLGRRSGSINAAEHEGRGPRSNPQARLLVIHCDTKAFSP